MKTWYKIFFEPRKNILLSCCGADRIDLYFAKNDTIKEEVKKEGQNILLYPPHVWTEPSMPYSKLFIFADQLDAESFLFSAFQHAGRMSLWRCQVREPEPCPLCSRRPTFDVSFWKNRHEVSELAGTLDFVGKSPVGTYISSAVKPTRRITKRIFS